jgi:hypothetical protein
MNGRIKRRLVWETKGVSEIVGTILMLSITVVLFSSIITYVGRIPPPQEAFHVELKCDVAQWDPINPGLGVNFYIQHRGGEELDPLFIRIFLTVDAVTLLPMTIFPGLVDDSNNGLWGVSETWTANVSQTDLGFQPLPTSTYSVLIVNAEKNVVVWQETINTQKNTFGPIILDTWIDSDLGTLVDDAGPISYQNPFRIYAKIMDPEGMDLDHGLDPSSIWVNMSSVQLGSVQLLDVIDSRSVPGDDVYEAVIDTPPTIDEASPGYYHFVFNASDFDNNTVQRSAIFPVGIIIGDNPQIWVYEIDFSDQEPVNGDTITISATIRNVGQVGALVDVWFYDENNNNTLIGGANTNVSLAGLSERDAQMQWKAAPGGVHMINVTAQINETYAAINRVYDPYLNDNTNYTNLTVMPKILVVDDDGELNDKGDRDTASFMQASLEASDFEYDFTGVGVGDGPGYDYGDFPLKNYDVVIWMTGYQTANTLTKTPLTGDIANLEKFLAGNPTGNKNLGSNGGSLWFISQGFWEEASSDAVLSPFAVNYMNVPGMPANKDDALPSLLWGNSTHPVTDYFTDNPIETANRVTGDAKYLWSFNWSSPTIPTRGALNSSDASDFYAISYNSANDSMSAVEDSRIFVQTWEFSRIEDTATQAQLTYKVLMWLGNITQKFTKDVAISEQTVEPEIIFFKQNVTIRFVIRNNGFNNYTTNENLYYLLRITDLYGNDLIVPVLEKVDFLDTGNNNTVTITYNWTPLEIGYHRLQIKVDPWDYIDESNELNNEISDFLTSGEVDVQYRILVVDDDSSSNNGGTGGALNETATLTSALGYLNSTSTTYTYEMFVVDENLGGFGPPYDDANSSAISLNKYNAVLWVTGEYNLTAPLKDNDTVAIMEYLNNSGNLWLIGDGMWTDLDETVTTFQSQYLKINSVDGNKGIYSALKGVKDDAVSHGMQYSANTSLGPNGDVLIPESNGIGFFYQNSAMTMYNSVRFEGAPPSGSAIYRVATTSWLLSSLNSEYSRAEITFMMLRWFEKPETRIETRLTDVDISVSNSHPQLGNGYVIQATVYNVGGSTGNVLVRFMDGSTQIGSDSISVMPDERTTAEVIWIPLFAGSRQLSVLVDPILEVPEIFDWSNNNASQSIYVYFFWDDMENGTSRWSHSSTVLLINGEGPLEYSYINTVVDTNISTMWDSALSIGLVPTSDTYHSFETSFFLEEPTGGGSTAGRIPLDVVFALDTSGSMANQPIADLKTATVNFIMNLTADDRVAIWTFGDDSYDYPYDDDSDWNDRDPSLLEPFAFMTDANKFLFCNAVNGTAANGWTPFYDTLGEAIRYSLSYDPTASDMARYEYVIGMTDGESNNDEAWTPNTYWGSTMTDGTYGMNKVKQGLRNPPPMVYTIGLNIVHDLNYPLAPNWSRTPPAPNEGVEYDLWSVPDSSPNPEGKYGFNLTTGDPNVGHYYFSNNSNQLPNIFQQILDSIVMIQLEGENQTRSQGPIEEPMALYSSTYDYNGVTQGSGPPDAYYKNVPGGAMDTANWNMNAGGTWTETSNTNYQNIAVDDFNNWGFDPNDAKYYRFEYNISEAEASVTRIDATIICNSANAAAHTLYIWNHTSNSWVQLATSSSAGWQTLTGARTTSIPDYINGTKVCIAFYQVDDNGNMQIDYTNITIWVNDTVAPTITATSPMNGDIGVALNAQIVIDFSERMNTGSVLYTCAPNPGGWAVIAWENGDTRLRLSHNNFIWATLYTFTVTHAHDRAGNDLVAGAAPNPWTFTTVPDTFRPYIVSTDPVNGTLLVPLDYNIVITFNESMNTATVNWSCTPDPTGWNPTWNAGNTILTLTHLSFLESTWYNFTISEGEDLAGNVLNSGPVPNPWMFETWKDIVAPTIVYTSPWNNQTNVPINLQVKIKFSEKMNTGSVSFICSPNPGGWISSWSIDDALLTLIHTKFQINTQYQITITTAADIAGNNFVNTGAINPWKFTTGETAVSEMNYNKTAVTETINLANLEQGGSAKLTFWHKYNMMSGANGGFLQVGTKNSTTGEWMWKYVIPSNAYSGNLRSSVWVNDSYGTRIYWCWNGVSGRGTFDWEYVQLNLLDVVPVTYRNEVKVKFNYTQYGQGTGYGWYLDDVRVTVTRSNNVNPVNTTQDVWNRTNATHHSGNYSWANVDPVTGQMKPGIDNYLMTTPIDLTRAKNAYLSAYFKFNINRQDGAPPDGFLVEVSTNGGVTWSAVNHGVRSCYGLSGTGLTQEGNVAISGLPDSLNPAQAAAYGYWASASTMSRLNVDLGRYIGNQVYLRFRVVTCNHEAYTHNDNVNSGIPTPPFGGFYVDDVNVYGETVNV